MCVDVFSSGHRLPFFDSLIVRTMKSVFLEFRASQAPEPDSAFSRIPKPLARRRTGKARQHASGAKFEKGGKLSKTGLLETELGTPT